MNLSHFVFARALFSLSLLASALFVPSSSLCEWTLSSCIKEGDKQSERTTTTNKHFKLIEALSCRYFKRHFKGHFFLYSSKWIWSKRRTNAFVCIYFLCAYAFYHKPDVYVHMWACMFMWVLKTETKHKQQ